MEINLTFKINNVRLELIKKKIFKINIGQN